MPIVGVKLGLTLQIGEREYFRPEMSVEGIDTSLPLEPQLKEVRETLPKAFITTSKLLLDHVEKYLKKEE